jgi:hypothetical protein
MHVNLEWTPITALLRAVHRRKQQQIFIDIFNVCALVGINYSST